MNNSQPRTSLRKQLHCIYPQHTHSPCTATCTTHPAIPSQLSSTTLASFPGPCPASCHLQSSPTSPYCKRWEAGRGPGNEATTTLLCTQLTNTKHSWQNDTRCRDDVKVLWCCSHLVWLVFEGFIPTCTCFHSENFFVTCSLILIPKP